MSFARCRGCSWLDWVGSAVACRGISTVRLWPAATMVGGERRSGQGSGGGLVEEYQWKVGNAS